MNIGTIAERSGLPAKTIRYYEDIGLIKAARASNGYRTFDETDLHRLTFLHRARALGFGIEDCRDLLDLYNDSQRSSADVKKIAEQHLLEIDRKIKDLQSMQRTLSDLSRNCAGDDRPDCPILNGLSQTEKPKSEG